MRPRGAGPTFKRPSGRGAARCPRPRSGARPGPGRRPPAGGSSRPPPAAALRRGRERGAAGPAAGNKAPLCGGARPEPRSLPCPAARPAPPHSRAFPGSSGAALLTRPGPAAPPPAPARRPPASSQSPPPPQPPPPCNPARRAGRGRAAAGSASPGGARPLPGGGAGPEGSRRGGSRGPGTRHPAPGRRLGRPERCGSAGSRGLRTRGAPQQRPGTAPGTACGRLAPRPAGGLPGPAARLWWGALRPSPASTAGHGWAWRGQHRPGGDGARRKEGRAQSRERRCRLPAAKPRLRQRAQGPWQSGEAEEQSCKAQHQLQPQRGGGSAARAFGVRRGQEGRRALEGTDRQRLASDGDLLTKIVCSFSVTKT